MIETSLIKLNDAVNDGQKLSAGLKVILPIGEEAEIYGFIAIENDNISRNIDMPPLGECQVFSNRVLFYMDKELYRFPIFTSVGKPLQSRYELYMLYIPTYFHLSTSLSKFYKDSLVKERPNPNVGRLDGVKIENNIAYYYPNESDLFFETRSKFRGIGTGFAIISRRVAKLSEDIKYEIFDSYSVMIERKL